MRPLSYFNLILHISLFVGDLFLMLQRFLCYRLSNTGMESLGTAVTLFEDALSAYSSQGPGRAMALTTQEEAEFVHSLQAVIEGAYTLQDQCEHLFLHQVGTGVAYALQV